MSSSDSGSTSVFTSIISGDSSSTIQIVIALLASSVGFVVAVVNAIAAYFRDKKHMEELAAQERRFEAFKKELEDKQRRLVRFENVQELMKQYKKPLLQSAFDLQARLANQIKSNFLHQFARKGNDRDREYARLNMAYVISEFLGWLEVIRQEIVFIVGEGNQTSNLNLIIDAIKFQFTGETPVQGNGRPGDPGVDEHWQVLQLYAGELRAIGEVMITERSYDDDDHLGSNLSVIGYAEFVRRMAAEVPTAPEELSAWKSSKEKLQQDILSPLLSYIERLMALDREQAPRQRIAILQVLLCKLIDVLDDAVPYEIGPEYIMEDGEEPRYISRDFRLTPLVKYLSKPQLKWLAEQRFMEKVAEVDRRSWEDWYMRVCELAPEDKDIYLRLAFPGFREDLHRDRDGKPLTQHQREERLKADGYPGAFPPRQHRQRETWWWSALSPEEHRRWYNEAMARGAKLPPANNHSHPHRTGSAQREAHKQAASNWSLAILRHRGKAAAVTTVAVRPEPAAPQPPQNRPDGAGGYTAPNILTSPSVLQLRTATSGGGSSSSASRTVTPLQVQVAGALRAPAAL